MTLNTHPEAHPDDPHYISRAGWLRAAVLGANDGIVSIGSLIVGVAAASDSREAVLLAAVAGLVAGAMSMAAGEYVSVSSQADIEKADIRRERRALRSDPEIELEELIRIYEARGLAPDTARLVAVELTEHDALGAHLRDELGLSEIHAANPIVAAIASGATFTVAGAIPLVTAMIAPHAILIPTVLAMTLVALMLLGAVGAKAGGAPSGRAILRVLVWGTAAMAITAVISRLFGVTVG